MEQLSPRWHQPPLGYLSVAPLVWNTTCPPALNPGYLSQTFAKVRNLLEKRTADETQNLKISFEDEDTMEHGRRAQWGHVSQCPSLWPQGFLGVLVCLPLAQQMPTHRLPPGLEADLGYVQDL